MATSAPMGTTARPASTRATNQGSPALPARCPNVLAPRAMKAAWHSETWPDTHTSRARARKSGSITRALV